MLRQGLPLMFIAVSALSVLAAHAEDRLLLKSVNVDLPVGDRMFEGPGSDVANIAMMARRDGSSGRARFGLSPPTRTSLEAALGGACANDRS